MSMRCVSIITKDDGRVTWRKGRVEGPPFDDAVSAVYGAARDTLGYSITEALEAVDVAKRHGVKYRNRFGGGDVYALHGVQWTLP